MSSAHETWHWNPSPSRQDSGNNGGGNFGMAFNVVVGAVLLGLAAIPVYLVMQDDRGAVSGFEQIKTEPLVPGLADRAGDVARLRITSSGSAVTLDRRGGEWLLQERDGYPADRAAVDELIGTLAGLDVMYVAQNARGGIPAEEAVRVRLSDEGGEQMADVTIGSERSAPGGESVSKLHVRRGDGGPAMLADGTLAIEASPVEWMDRELVHVPRDDVMRVGLVREDGTTTEIRRQGADGEFTVERGSLPGQGSEQEVLLDTISGALQRMVFEDVRPADELGASLPADPHKVEFVTRHGLALSVTLRRAHGVLWATLSAAPNEGANEKTHTAAREFNQLHEGWAYRIFGSFSDIFFPEPEPGASPRESSKP